MNFASKTQFFPESGKRFQGSGMHAIDSPHKITPRKMILRQETQNFSIFASIQNTHFPETGKHFQAFLNTFIRNKKLKSKRVTQ
jgi:hypothetical protein